MTKQEGNKIAVNIRMDRELADRIKAIALSEHRSVAAQIVVLLEKSLKK